jgi:hypothetical protein
MPFFAPNHAIIEAIEYDGTPQSAIKIIKWAKQRITTSDQIKFSDSRLLVVYRYPGSTDLEKMCEVIKGNFVCIITGSVRILCKKDIKQNYELILSW